jgi:hypothetical protein
MYLKGGACEGLSSHHLVFVDRDQPANELHKNLSTWEMSWMQNVSSLCTARG